MILLSFDIEEFDMPLEYGGKIPFEQQIAISRTGLERLLQVLNKHNAKATFFSTAVFAQNCTDLVEKLIADGHELASHTYYHSQFAVEDLKRSKEELERLFSVEITGLRMPRMRPVEATQVAKAGYLYNSSINPTYLPGRYNNLNAPRRYFKEDGVWQIPASVSFLRVPLFWLSFHNFPMWLYRCLTKYAISTDGYLNTYFHPWEFAPIDCPEFRLPKIATRRTDWQMVERFDAFLHWLTQNGYRFGTFNDLLKREKME